MIDRIHRQQVQAKRQSCVGRAEEEPTMPIYDDYESWKLQQFHYLLDSDHELQTLIGPLHEEQVIGESSCRVGKYKLTRKIGCGAFGEVWEAKQYGFSSKRVVAVKKFDKANFFRPSQMKMLRTELKLMTTLKHKNLLSAREVIQGRNSIYVVMEKAIMDLHTYLDSQAITSLKSQKTIIRGALRGLAYLHENNVAHMDIKAANILIMRDVPPDQLKTSDIKLCDLGLAVVGNDDGMIQFDRFRGTALYAAPETRVVESSLYDCRKADMWSLGVMIMDLMDIVPTKWGRLMKTKSTSECRSTYNSAMIDFWHLLQDHERTLEYFIWPLLHFDADDRPTACAALENPWIQRKKSLWNRAAARHNSSSTKVQPLSTSTWTHSQLYSLHL